MQTSQKWVLAILAVLLLAIGTFAAINIVGWQNRDAPTHLFGFTKNDVAVEIALKKYSPERLELLATFTPTREHFHLYSKDLPRDGLAGLGRPTLLEVRSPSDVIRLTGPLTANQPPRELYYKTLDVSFPVYPEGAVTLSQPFAWTGKMDAVELSVTYMACSDQTCLAPVIDKRFTAKFPRP